MASKSWLKFNRRRCLKAVMETERGQFYVSPDDRFGEDNLPSRPERRVRIAPETYVIADRLRKAARAKRVSFRELADRIGVSASLMGGIVNCTRNPSAEIIAKLAAELGVSADWLLGSVAESPQELEALRRRKSALEAEAQEAWEKPSKRRPLRKGSAGQSWRETSTGKSRA